MNPVKEPRNYGDKASPRDYEEFTALRGLDDLVEERQALDDMIKQLQQDKDEMSERIANMLHKIGDETVRCGPFTIIWRGPSTSRRLNKDKLLELGVLPATINAAMVESKRPGNLQIRTDRVDE